jgi:hypothetical protein
MAQPEASGTSYLTIHVRVDGMDAEQLRDALGQTSTHNPMNEVEEALWVELNPYDDIKHDRKWGPDVDVVDWDVTDA